MPNYYHYADDEETENIIRAGKILASLKFMNNGDEHCGTGVYLTDLSPNTSTKHQIAMNNWQNTNANTMRKLKNYFILDIPESNIKDTIAGGRNIFLFGYRNDLRLSKFKWVLKDYDTGITIASYKYKISATIDRGVCMGDFVMINETVNGRPVYKRVKGSEWYLFMSSKGKWMVGLDPEEDKCGLFQTSNYSLGPHQNVPWKYLYRGSWEYDDTLKVTAYGGTVTVFCFENI